MNVCTNVVMTSQLVRYNSDYQLSSVDKMKRFCLHCVEPLVTPTYGNSGVITCDLC